MNYKKILVIAKYLLILFIFLGFWASLNCISLINPDSGQKLYQFGKFESIEELYKKLSKYQNPKGILPDTFIPFAEAISDNENEAKNGDAFLYISSLALDFREFFVFDKRHVLIILSLEPLYFIEIEDISFYHHFQNQFEQIKAGFFSKAKLIVTVPYLKKIGSISAEVYFSPNEINYQLNSDNMAIRQTGPKNPPLDLWRLFTAADLAEIYFPEYTDEGMHQVIQEHILLGKKRKVFTKQLGFFENGTEYIHLASSGPLFAYVSGESLEITEELLGDASPYFTDLEALTQDFIFLFSFSPTDKSGDFVLNRIDGSTILIRGSKHDLLGLREALATARQNSNIIEVKEPIHRLVISEIANKYNNETNNDYLLLYNPNPFPLSLGGLYIARDSGCNLENSWTEFKALPLEIIKAHSYFLIAREDNTIGANWTWDGSITSDYCLALVRSSLPPKSILDESIINFVHFSDLQNESIYQRNGTCKEQNTNDFATDFILLSDTSDPLFPSSPLSAQSPECDGGGNANVSNYE